MSEHEHEFIHTMASDWGICWLSGEDGEDFVIQSRCACGMSPVDVLLTMRVTLEAERVALAETEEWLQSD
jgi:hypothetical protein